MAIKISGTTVIYDDQVFKTATGNTASRPVSPVTGMIRFNTELSILEVYTGSEWISAGGPSSTPDFLLIAQGII